MFKKGFTKGKAEGIIFEHTEERYTIMEVVGGTKMI